MNAGGIADHRAALERRERSSEELARAALERASPLNPALNAFLQLLPDQALVGIPVALKDNMCLGHEPELGSYGGRTTCASRRGAPDALPVVKVGKYVRFRPADLLEYIDRRSRAHTCC